MFYILRVKLKSSTAKERFVVVVVVFEGKGLATVLRKEKGIPPRFISRNNTQFLRV